MAELKMPELNYVLITGNLTKDPVYRNTGGGKPVINFTLASNRKYKDSSNTWQEDVCFIGIVAWNKLAVSCKDSLKKGSPVLVEGELQSRNWKNDDGLNRSIVEIKARRIQFLHKKFKNGFEDEENIFADDSENDFLDEDKEFSTDSFNKFLSEEESQLLNNFNNNQ